METRFVPCRSCQSPVEILTNWQSEKVLCLKCGFEADKILAKSTSSASVDAKWARICPPQYQDTSLSMLPNVNKSSAALKIKLDVKGACLWGPSGTGKTRTMFLMLRGCVNSNKSVQVFLPGEYTSKSEKLGHNRSQWLDTLASVDVLALDDLGKFRLPKHYADDLFAVIERRCAHKRPILITTNLDGGQLSVELRHGMQIARRIRDFCHTIHFGYVQKHQELLL